MDRRPRLLDLFCGAGGAAMGYYRAGFDVVGVDIKPQPHYPFEFHQGDATTWPLEGYDVIHASPPCQAYTTMTNPKYGRGNHPDLLPGMRERLLAQPTPWVIENVPGSPMRADYVLCGTQFGLKTIRHRWFEVSFGPVIDLGLTCNHKPGMFAITGHGTIAWGREWRVAHGLHPTLRVDEIREIMQMPWSDRDGLSQAIPPAYTQYIGEQLMRYLDTNQDEKV
jgi:hypothetical protein